MQMQINSSHLILKSDRISYLGTTYKFPDTHELSIVLLIKICRSTRKDAASLFQSAYHTKLQITLPTIQAINYYICKQRYYLKGIATLMINTIFPPSRAHPKLETPRLFMYQAKISRVMRTDYGP